MIDNSHFMLDGNMYTLFKENAADIYSFHSNPSTEETMWTYLGSLARRYGKSLGYHENYHDMYGRDYLPDERVAKHAIRRFFFNLYARDVRNVTWWLRYTTSPTDYVAAYGGGTFNLDHDQTIFRWSTTELAPMFARGRRLERALIDTVPETSRIAVVQPSATVLNRASMGVSHRDCPTLQSLLDAHRKLLEPMNFAHEFITEEMVLDGAASLAEFQVLVLPPARWMSQELSSQLGEWVMKGGTLVAVGPFALVDEYSHELPRTDSLFQRIFPEAKRTGADDWSYSVAGEDPATATVLLRRYGRGTVAYLNAPLATITHDAQRTHVLEQLISRAAHRRCPQQGT